MTELFLNNIYLILLLPFWLFLIIMVGRFFAVYVNKFIIYTLTLFSSAFGFILCGGALHKFPADKIIESSFPFLKINDFIISCGLHIDRTSLIFVTTLFLVSFFVQIFSISFMKEEKKNYRFYALMNLFNFSMAGLFFSPNLFQTYFFWEIAGVVSYLLIGFEYSKNIKSLASKKVFIINRIGDTALITAIIICSYFLYTYAPNKSLATLSFIDINSISTLVYAYAGNPWFEIICLLFIIGAIVKSAQFPFYTWLQDAMEAKLPVSALLHSSTLVASGIYLTLRLIPFYTLEPVILKLLIIIGVLTSFICSLSAIAQNNSKKVLAYSTSAQLGLIFISIGLLNIKVALAYFVAHAFIKSLLFITLPKDDEKWNYFSFIIFLISALSLSGLILSGMITKEMLATNLGIYGTAFVSVISFLTAFYIIRIGLVYYDKVGLEKRPNNIFNYISMSGLLILNILFYIYLHKTAQYKIAEPFWASLTAWICVYILYIKNAFWKVPFLYNLCSEGFYLDKFYMNICIKLYNHVSNFSNFIDKKVFANYRPLIYTAKSGVNTFSFIENKIMNETLNFIAKTIRKLSIFDLKAQNGSIQRYNTYAFLIITLIILGMLLIYFIIILLEILKGVI